LLDSDASIRATASTCRADGSHSTGGGIRVGLDGDASGERAGRGAGGRSRVGIGSRRRLVAGPGCGGSVVGSRRGSVGGRGRGVRAGDGSRRGSAGGRGHGGLGCGSVVPIGAAPIALSLSPSPYDYMVRQSSTS
jgi:hypothetical protein